jgi:hypothetical protein
MPPDAAIAKVYGPYPLDEPAPGAQARFVESETDHRNRVAGVRSMRAAAMKTTIIPSGSDVEGMLFVGQTGLARPIAVRVTLSGRPYLMRFGLPRPASGASRGR